MAKTKIEWTDYSWPVINGCRKVSPGCANCYAERLTATRLRHLPRYKDLAIWKDGKPLWTGKSRLDGDELLKPLTWKKPRRIFVAEMGDLFFDGNSEEEIAAVFSVMAACHQHTFLVLTKRPERASEVFGCTIDLESFEATVAREAERYGRVWDSRGSTPHLYPKTPPNLLQRRAWVWPLPNVHFGVTIENQDVAQDRLANLGHIPAIKRWVSAEPLIGPLDLLGSVTPRLWAVGGIDWLVVGCESGPKRRPCKLEWVEALVDQCLRLGVPVFVKQLNLIGQVSKDPSEWPTWLRRREYP